MRPNSCEIVVAPDDPFAQKKSGGEFCIMPGRPHRDDERVRIDLNFERLLDGEFIDALGSPTRLPALNASTGCGR